MEHTLLVYTGAFTGHTVVGEPYKRAICYEDGKNMRNFLDLVEIDFDERGLDARHWGEELRRYLRGDALGYWLYLRRTGAPLSDWEILRQQFCARFCNITKERMKVMMAENVWRGDHTAYSSRFAAIVAQGVSMAPDLLVGYYLANLPDDIYREVTRGGTRKFTDWQDAAAALDATAAPWKDSCEERLRFQRDLEDAKRRWAQGEREQGLQRERASKSVRGNANMGSLCYECRGKGHVSRDCPLRIGVTRRNGEMCSRCGGWDHYARDCPTPARPREEPVRQPRQQQARSQGEQIEAFKRAGLVVKGDERTRLPMRGTGTMCTVATGPNPIPVSPDWSKKLPGREP
ncbi:LOW QUALITY PROTEIN: uncharacterized protein EMH_0087850 [Eimeria mitis]|uniref:CCHC-type domain-containing protein n=1 Tax=Eimeria mitis TaxID=44415 RepID=U6KBC9_9EIME|nr:LOW QUALITY PROTEIN: uncharacterized protein EMH_0087850 [Eimeria mitis]CDJ34106.1 hypothetical protein, conserved [Eimeria mitis]